MLVPSMAPPETWQILTGLGSAVLLLAADMERAGKPQENQVGLQGSWIVHNRARFLAEGQYHETVILQQYLEKNVEVLFGAAYIS